MSSVMVLSLADVRGIEPRRIGLVLSDSGLAGASADVPAEEPLRSPPSPRRFVPLDESEWGGGRSSRSWAKHRAKPVECTITLVVPHAYARRGTEGAMMDLVQMRAANWPVRSHGCQ